MDFYPEVELDQAAAEAIARGLFAVAKADGMHERERALVASFWSDAGGGANALADLDRAAPITPAELVAALRSDEQRVLFVKSAFLLTWADGQVSAEERQVVADFAAALGLSGEASDRLEASVKEYLLGHLATLKNSEAVAEVAKELKV